MRKFYTGTMKRPVWVVFDVGGVIFDYQKAFTDIATYLEVEKEKISEKIASYRGDSERGGKLFDEILRETLKDIKKEHEYEKVYDLWWDVEKFLVGTKDVIIDLQKAGYKLAFFTNNWEGMHEKVLETLPQLGMIDMLFESSREGFIKPEKAFYQLVEQKTGASGWDIYFIDDVKANIAAAQELGWQTFLYELGKDGGESANRKIREILLDI